MAWQTMYPATPGSPYTTLAVGIADDDTSISLTTDPGFAAATNLACIWDDAGNFEVVKYTTLSGTTLTVERGFEGIAQAWSAGAYIANLIPAHAINSLQNNVNELNSSKLSAIDIHGTTEETTVADDDEILIYDKSANANRRMTKANLVSGLGGGGGGITWNDVTSTSQSASVDNGYITNNSSLVTVTLPSTVAVGKTIRVAGSGSGGWKIAQNASQIIYFGDMNTTSGTEGYLASNNQYDGVELLCITANTTFVVISSMGDITVV